MKFNIEFTSKKQDGDAETMHEREWIWENKPSVISSWVYSYQMKAEMCINISHLQKITVPGIAFKSDLIKKSATV